MCFSYEIRQKDRRLIGKKFLLAFIRIHGAELKKWILIKIVQNYDNILMLTTPNPSIRDRVHHNENFVEINPV